MIVNETKKILKEYQCFAKKMYGQNFLIQEHVLKKIMQIGAVTKEDCIIEIGPGIGSLTEYLSINAKHVLCYEIDSDMITILNHTLKDYHNITILHQDILKADIKKDIETYFPKDCKIKVISNIPYYITTPILFKLLDYNCFSLLLFMVQKELGERLTGTPKTKDYNALSVIMNYKANASIKYNISRNCFYPAPNVESALLLVKSKINDYSLNNESNFLKFVQCMFSQRRKTLVNNLSCSYKIDKKEIIEILNKLGYSEKIRSEELTLEEIIRIYSASNFAI